MQGTGSCGWNNYSGPLNCQYLKDLIYNLQVSFSVPVSIVTMRDVWFKAFKDYQGCPEISEQLLWWVPDSFLDQKANFDDFIPFGGWKIPFAKLYT